MFRGPRRSLVKVDCGFGTSSRAGSCPGGQPAYPPRPRSMEWTRGWLFNCYGPLTFDGTGVGETPRRSLHQFAGGRSKRKLVGGIIDHFVALPQDAPYGGCAESAVHECPAGPEHGNIDHAGIEHRSGFHAELSAHRPGGRSNLLR